MLDHVFDSLTPAGQADGFLISAGDHVSAPVTVITATAQTQQSPAVNVATPLIGERWRSPVLDPVLTVDFGGDRAVGLLLLRFPRDVPLPGGTLRHRLDPASGTAGDGAAHDSGPIPIGAVEGYGYHAVVLPVPVSARWWTVEIDATGVAHVDIGRAWAAPFWRPGIGPAWGLGESWADISSIVSNDRSGAEFVDLRARVRTLEWTLAAISDAERQAARELTRVAGVSRQVVAMIRPASDPARETVLGRLADQTPLAWSRFGLNSKRFTLRESV